MKIDNIAKPNPIQPPPQSVPPKPPLSSYTSTLSSKREIQGLELFAKSSLALTLGFLPFTIAYIGKGALQTLTTCGSKCHPFFRFFLGFPAFLSALLLTGGSILFALTQKIAWGTELVKHPQEEKANTIMARYGAGSRPLQDLKAVFNAFFLGQGSLDL